MERDQALFLDMLNAARQSMRITEGRSLEAFRQDEVLPHATIRLLTIIGEAANQISTDVQSAQPEIPWSDIIGMRNILVHDYARVNLTIIWDTVRHNLPPLVEILERLTSPPES